MATTIQTDSAFGKVSSFKVKSSYPRIINDNEYVLLVNSGNQSIIVAKDEFTESDLRGKSVLIETRGAFATIIEVQSK